MTTTYFLGANSGRGFASLYKDFAAGDYLHVIKGGPGTGKSGFMREIGRKAQERGYDVEYVLCSGDPASLDGVYIPALCEAWVDGTAPHILDPAVFGASGDYVNLGRFCRLPLDANDALRAAQLNVRYKEEYRRAYAFLAAAMELDKAKPKLFPTEKIEKRVESIAARHIKKRNTAPGKVRYRYMSAISCIGSMELYSKLCKPTYILDDRFGAGSYALGLLAKKAKEHNADAVICPSPLDAELIEAVIFPDAVYLTERFDIPGARHIRLDSLIPDDVQREHRAELRTAEREHDKLIALATDRLKRAKALHDELEAVYRPHMDFAALTEFTEGELTRIFG